jgi:GNAT superfamily N-acetyltransferase
VEIRDLDRTDAPAVAALFARSRAASMPWLPVLHTGDEHRAFFGSRLAAATGLGADLGGSLVGFAIAAPGWLEHLYVEPELRGRGIGRALVEAVRGRIPGDLQLWAFARNTAALGFYARLGAVEQERTDGSGNEERAPDVRLVLRGGADVQPRQS